MMTMFAKFHPFGVGAPDSAAELVRWDDAFSVGNGLIDGEHKAILHLLNLLYDDWRRDAHHLDLPGLVKELGRMLATHFANEEAVLGARSCPTLIEHKAEHRQMLSEFTALADDIQAGRATEEALVRFLKHVVIDHVLGRDLDLKRYLRH